MRDRLNWLLREEQSIIPIEDYRTRLSVIADIADYLLDNGVIVPPCKVGDIVWDTEGNAWKIFAITIWEDCIGLKTANSKDIRKTFTIGKRSIGKTVFLTKEEAEEALVNYGSSKTEKGGK